MRKRRKQAEIAPPHLEQKRVTPVDIQQKEFRLAMRGYNERDVDQFLDEVTEEIARLYADNKRLREEVEFGRTTRLETTGAAEADGILRQAREEAARIIAEATARASTIGAAPQPSGGPASGSSAPPSEIMGIFLARERAFLQNMANLIQAHAEGVKQDVRRVREQVPPQAPEVETPPEPAAEAAGEAGEPTGIWESTQEEARPRVEPSTHDIVDLTQGGDGATEEQGRDSADASQPAPESQAALSSAYGRTSASTETNEASGPPRERGPDGSPAPRVEDDDKEDRSIRELFWGED